jgi:NAD(P)-dependent dehydrogenase (short-subunit alcohol dehydrogenase family)
MEKHEKNVPLRRIGLPEDVAGAALYLASSAADWVTGIVLVVDGGSTLTSLL